ncbi:MAG TPA: aminoacetone oxidase family FAD-binding enzyme, partial [Bacteroidetes bacterium]|nr:aminoacetone oxidase family FAD-binding enzyme [Bacteroidota bacterium]
MKKVSIIGGGPAALMLAAQLDTEKYQVTLYDKKKSVGRKFLVAGEGGLNLTFNSDLEELITQYFPSEFMGPIIRQFTNEDVIQWLSNLEVSTFIGSSNRVFPMEGLKPIDVLNKLVAHIKSKNVKFALGTQWTGWNTDGHLCFEDSEDIESDITIFALGGASWKVTGSDGSWSGAFMERGINILPFRAANCAFHIDWDKNFIHTHAGKPLKNIALKYKKQSSKGELVVSEFGLEGNALYALSRSLQDEL